jgi:2-polyprenyl-3-methyl-5-hydroxy-6-metoxy-1,4-benzoquinol methylase
MLKFDHIDNDKEFDWGKASNEYSKYRDIYPEEFYNKLYENGIGLNNQKILDLGTGTGVIPRNMQKFGARFTGIDISKEQIEQAVSLSKLDNYSIDYKVCKSEDIRYAQSSFDAVTAVQCLIYFDKEKLLPKLSKILKPEGLFVKASMIWLPYEDDIAKASEDMVLKYNHLWTGAKFKREYKDDIKMIEKFFKLIKIEELDLNIPFTRKSWNGRIKACRGICASLSQSEISNFEKEHLKMLESITSENFTIKHFARILIFKLK